MKKLVLFSGGLDSTTALAMAVNEYGSENCVALSLYYGQKHEKELESAKKITQYYKVQHLTMNVDEIFKNSNCSLLKQSKEEIPEQTYEEQIAAAGKEAIKTYVPFRNGLFLSISASLALSLGCDLIFYGAHKDDAAGDAYPDCSEDFNNAINEAIYQGTGKRVKVTAPFIDKTKADIVKIGTELKVPYEMTWSCYNGKDKPCRKCGTCIDREKAFELNGLTDPLITKEV